MPLDLFLGTLEGSTHVGIEALPHHLKKGQDTMKRVASICVVLLVLALCTVPFFAATAQVVRIKIDAINPFEYLSTPPAGTLPISTGLRIVPMGMRVYFAADTTGSGASVVSSFSWSIIAKPGTSSISDAALYSTKASTTSFVTDTEGDYTVQLVAGGVTVMQTVTAATFVGTSTAQDCGGCHPYAAPAAVTAYSEWKTSPHANIFRQGISGLLETEPVVTMGDTVGAYGTVCIKCHTTGWDQKAANGNFGYLAHQGVPSWDTTWYKNPANTAVTGEYLILSGDTTNWAQLNNSYATLVGVANIGCEQCHGPASAHMLNAFTSDIKIDVSYRPGVCFPCHNASSKHSLGNNWAQSVHAKLPDGAHTAQIGCFPCHSGKAFIKWTKNKTTPGYDTTTVNGQLSPTNDGDVEIDCQTCHNPHSLELRVSTLDSLRNGYLPPANVGGAGILCANCHNSRYSVKARVTSKGPYFGFTNRYGPHNNNQADMYFGSNAYQYGDTTITGLMTHSMVEDACVTCHMQTGWNAASPQLPNHAVDMRDSLGNALPLALSACAPCHGVLTDFNDIRASADYDGNGKIEGFQTEVKGLLAKLKNRLPLDSTGNPVTMTTDSLLIKGNQRAVQDLWNYYFVLNDGSYGVHNPKYAIAILQKALNITFTGVKSLDGPVPTTFALNQNYPNPFNPSTTIEFALPQRETVRLDVFDILGRQVSTLVNAEMSAGTWRVVWNGKDANGSPVATGMYIYRIQAGSFSMVKKMLMIK
jgi:hypothetical protein